MSMLNHSRFLMFLDRNEPDDFYGLTQETIDWATATAAKLRASEWDAAVIAAVESEVTARLANCPCAALTLTSILGGKVPEIPPPGYVSPPSEATPEVLAWAERAAQALMTAKDPYGDDYAAALEEGRRLFPERGGLHRHLMDAQMRAQFSRPSAPPK